jgi:hypothetical protein
VADPQCLVTRFRDRYKVNQLQVAAVFVSFTDDSDIKMTDDASDRTHWTTDGNRDLVHKRRIDTGGSGTVHEVLAIPLTFS